MKAKKVYWKVHTPNLLKEIVNFNPTMAVMGTPISILGTVLFALADRARELNDPELNSLLCRLTLVTQADPESPDYDKRVQKLISKYDESLLKRIS